MPSTVRDYRKLVVWQKSHLIALDVYRLTEKFPKSQTYSLVSQMQRAAVSIPANIAEGCGRSGTTELARYMTIAQGSASELGYYTLLAGDLGYVTAEKHESLNDRLNEIARMLTSYIEKLRG